MKSLIITINYNQHKNLAELFPLTNVINLGDLKSISYFKDSSWIAMVVDVDYFPALDLDDIIRETKDYHDKIIFTSNSREKVEYLQKWGKSLDKNQNVIADEILRVYSILMRKKHEGYIFDYENRTVSDANNVYKIQNTPFLILSHLVKNANIVCTREELIEIVYSFELEKGLTTINMLSDARSVDVHIHNLRKTIKDNNIKTVVNEGYMYEDLNQKKKKKNKIK